MRLLIQHRSRYEYPTPATLGPQVVRLKPAQHTKARIESYGLHITPDADIRWQQDPNGNHIARVSFENRPPTLMFEVLVELAVDIHQVNPFDFFLDDACLKMPFAYPKALDPELVQYLQPVQPPGSDTLFREFLKTLSHEGDTIARLVDLIQAVKNRVNYVIREEPGVWLPEETLKNGRGSCRDSALLLVAILREWGLAARFVSGYLVQLTDEGMIPDQPKGVGRDVVDLHAWAEVFLPGGGWIGLDGTSGLFCGEGHIPLASSALPQTAAPIEGATDVGADKVSFEVSVGRLGHEPRPTAPFEEATWQQLLASGERVDAKLRGAGVKLTCGGEPTFNAREDVALPEWNTAALGPSKWSHGLRLAEQLRERLAPGAALIVGQGKQYPGEPLPRWSLEICGRRDGQKVWTGKATPEPVAGVGVEHARKLAAALAKRLGVPDAVLPAFEDPWPYVMTEERLPLDIDPLKANLQDSSERRRLAHLLDSGMNVEAGYVLPLARTATGWRSESWKFKRDHLFLIPGDSPIGLRLPLQSLPAAEVPDIAEEPVTPPDPRRAEPTAAQKALLKAARPLKPVRTALCVEAREGRVHIFLPPVEELPTFFTLLEAIDEVRGTVALPVMLEGYGPPPGPELFKFAVTPDPGVLEVNIPPTASVREHADLVETVFNAALHAGLHSEKYMLDGRLAGSGGGNHLTMGGPTPLTSPFIQRPDLLASIVTFVQHHPSLSYLFTGLFVGPTSQAPRLDEARHDALEGLEIANARAFDRTQPVTPWLGDLLYRHILVDVAGNTHRTEICIDKLFGVGGASTRQGLVELRAFEMPPHFRMITAQLVLMRALVATFVAKPYEGQPVRWGQSLHDRFLLPYYLWRDFEDVLAYLKANDLPLPADAYRPFLELRCPLNGTLQAGDVALSVRNAIEPWPVLGEEMSASGTSRYVDSSMERVEVLVEGLVPERHVVTVNGHRLPLQATATAGQFVAGVRFRAWAPPHSMHGHLGIHHPLKFDVLDTWAHRSLGACAYHVWHPEGRGFDEPPLTRSEAIARRSRRFTEESPMAWPADAVETRVNPNEPCTLDLRRYPMDRPMPKDVEEEAA